MDMIGIHFVCCFFSTHESLRLTPQLASTTCQCVCVCVCVCVFGATAVVLRRRRSPQQLLPRRRLVFVLVPCCLLSAPRLCLPKQPVLSAVRARLVVAFVCVFNTTVKPLPSPFIPCEFHKRANQECAAQFFVPRILWVSLYNKKKWRLLQTLLKLLPGNEKYATLSSENSKQQISQFLI